MTEEKRAIIRYRIQEAIETLEDAEMLLARDRLRSAANRIYYGMFYATAALLAARNLSSVRHSGAIALFGEHFVKTGEFPKDLYRLLGQGFDLRSQGDYKDLAVLERPLLDELLTGARAFVAEARNTLQSLGIE